MNLKTFVRIIRQTQRNTSKKKNLRHALYDNPYSEEAYNSSEVQEISSIFDRKVTFIRKPEEYKKNYNELIEYMEEQRKVIEATSEALKLIRKKEVSQEQ